MRPTDLEAAPLVLQLAPNDHPPFADLLLSYRLALESLGCEVETVCLAPPKGAAVAGIHYLGLEDLSRHAGKAALGVEALVADRKPVLAVCHRYRSYRVLRRSALKVPRVVAVAHEFSFFKRFQRRLERRLFGRHVLFAGVSPAVQAELGKEVEDPLLLPNALDLASLAASRLDRDAACARLGLGVVPKETFTVGLVGRLVEKKSPELAIQALAELKAAGKDVRLIVVGDGPLRAGLETLAEGLPVEFTGFVADARSLFQAFDALLLSSQAVEAFGMVALEAMCSRVPVVSGPLPGPQYVLGGSGFYYTERTPEAVAAAIVEVLAARDQGALTERLDHAEARAQREFSVAALARHLDPLFYHG
ncbi:MAG: glycosyltransferase [Pseudomonadota bacterium]